LFFEFTSCFSFSLREIKKTVKLNIPKIIELNIKKDPSYGKKEFLFKKNNIKTRRIDLKKTALLKTAMMARE
tara:strand:- start:31 stop:246 length:216 start_codon:yes stop_codon:yes gene_type:complete